MIFKMFLPQRRGQDFLDRPDHVFYASPDKKTGSFKYVAYET